MRDAFAFRWCVAQVVALCLLCASSAAPAPQPDDYVISRFGGKEGAPVRIRALAQDRDGYLWLGSNEGLYRFDGFVFERWSDLSSESLEGSRVRSVYVDRRGRLWVGFDSGGVSLIEGRRVRNFHADDGLYGSAVRSIVDDGRGVVWAANAMGLYSFDGERWRLHPAFSEHPPLGLAADTVNLWVSTTDGIFQGRINKVASDPILTGRHKPDRDARAICVTTTGHLAMTDSASGFQVMARPKRPAAMTPATDADAIHCGHDGTLWVGTSSRGLWRVPLSTTVEAPAAPRIQTSLLTENVLAITEDRERNVWVGTTDGLYRLTPRPLTVLRDVGSVTSVTGDRAGRMWVGTDDGLMQYTRRDGTWTQTARYLGGARIRALHADVHDTLWIATDDAVVCVTRDGQLERPAWGSARGHIDSLTSDSRGALWLFDSEYRLIRVRDDEVSSFAFPDVFTGMPTTVIHVDRRDRLWLVNRTVLAELTLDGAIRRRYTAADGMPSRGFSRIHEDRAGTLWFGGPAGVSRLDDRGLVTLTWDISRPPYRLTGLLDHEDGTLWAGFVDGSIRRLNPTNNGTAKTGPARFASVFDDLSRVDTGMGGNAAARSAFGDFWFLTEEGVVIVDPRRIGTNSRPIRTRIAAVTVNGDSRDPGVSGPLPAGAARIKIDFSALELAAPERIRFRYRLENFDPEWIDAEKRRSVDYTNLNPGTYVFRVIAAQDGVDDSAPAAAWTFSIEPHFYQTTWFPVVAVLSLGVLTYGAWHVRMGNVRRRFGAVLGERMRVSREIHDTLLQSFFGVALELEALAQASPREPMRNRLIGLRKRVDEHLLEAREAILHLRSPVLEQHDLVNAVRRMGERVIDGSAVQFELHRHGLSSPCPMKVERELLLVAQEAISNALRHARATRIRVDIRTGNGAVELSVSDDGRGFDAGRLLADPGHCGLLSMRERTEYVGGRLSIDSSASAGTQVRAVVPLGVV